LVHFFIRARIGNFNFYGFFDHVDYQIQVVSYRRYSATLCVWGGEGGGFSQASKKHFTNAFPQLVRKTELDPPIFYQWES
jgi:hypothetical protein